MFMCNRLVMNLTLFGLLAGYSQLKALDLPGFRGCLSASGSGSTCELDPNWAGGEIVPWGVTTPIPVERSVTVQGNPSYPGQVSLLRAAAIGNIMTVSAPGVTIKSLVFDGNKPSYPSSSYVDLNFYHGSWNNYVIDCNFINSPGVSLQVIYYTYVQYCQFYNSGYVGVIAYSAYGDVTDIGIYNSYFYRVGTNAVFFNGGARNSIVYDSDFIENHYTCAWSSPGGQILLDPSTSSDYVQNNYVDGNYSYCPSYPQSSAGLEGYGSSHSVTGNTFKRHRWHGVYFTAASAITISSNTIESNDTNGINLSGKDGALTCSSNPSYTILSNSIQSNSQWGILAYRNGCSAGPSSSTISLSGNTITGNGSGTTSLNNP